MQSNATAKSTRLRLDESAAALAGVGPQILKKLGRLGIETVGDLLCLVPLRYEDRSVIRPIGGIRPGERVLIEGRIELSEIVYGRRRSLLCRLSDGTGNLNLRFFHFSRQQHDGLKRGQTLRCFGEARSGPTGIEMVHPECRGVRAGDPGPDAALTPVYPTTEGLTQARLRGLVSQALSVDQSPDDYLAGLLDGAWPTFDDALKSLHRPPSGSDIRALESGHHPGRRRIAAEELIAYRLSLKRSRKRLAREAAVAIDGAREHAAAFVDRLPFVLTAAQSRVVGELVADLAGSRPMNRLIQGDVGSGKTVVAAIAASAVAEAGFQVALMAPTEILAEQHALTMKSWFEPFGRDVTLLTGSAGTGARRAALEAIATGEARLVVGTHTLFQRSVEFERLALIIVDEQHRFGVDQRLALKQKGTAERIPHQLTMTATPIPRTLAMTAYANLDCSIIDELPAGRIPVETIALPRRRRGSLVEKIAGHCRGGAQAYWVCPLIESSELVDAQAAEDLYTELARALPDVRVGLVHGRLTPDRKDVVMRRFKAGEIDLLVATTVIEVGVDVPNASLMVIEGAERMGLAQLHQLRGRVGRGTARSVCVLLYEPGLNRVARERLSVLRATNDGFAIAEKDLELRGPGEVLGTRQTGLEQLRVADLVRDADLLPLVRDVSDRLETEFPERVAPLVRRWIRRPDDYARV